MLSRETRTQSIMFTTVSAAVVIFLFACTTQLVLGVPVTTSSLDVMSHPKETTVKPSNSVTRSRDRINTLCPMNDGENAVFLSFTKELEQTLFTLTHLKRSSESGFTSIADENLLSKQLREYMANDPMYFLPGLPAQPQDRNLTKDNMVSKMTKDYHDLSVFTVYTQIIHDEKVNNEVLQADLIKVKHYFYSILCRLQILLKVSNSSVEEHVTTDVMPSFLRNFTDHHKQYVRAYLLLDSVSKFTGEILTNYRKLQKDISSKGQ